MNCRFVRREMHAYLDSELAPRILSAIERHLESCQECQAAVQESRQVRSLLRLRVSLPEASGAKMRRYLEKRRGGAILPAVLERLDDVRIYWRDLDRRFLWSRISGVPLTMALFALLMAQFVPSQIEDFFMSAHDNGISVPVIALQTHSSAGDVSPLVRTAHLRQERNDVIGLISTAWKLPYEDSLSLVAEINPQGRAQIENVLEYPKNPKLLQAFDTALRGSRFANGRGLDKTMVFLSFHKIDVYESARGL
jgi:hypothetical protein